jgi:Fic family protein
MTEIEMQEQIAHLDRRVTSLETERLALIDQSKRIEANTSELLATFTALKGAWTVLNWIGKLAKPLGFVASIGALWYNFKDLFPKGH